MTSIKKILLGLCMCMMLNAFSQNSSINEFKYVIVPQQFEFQKNPNSYRVNELLAFLFRKEGFTVVSDSVAFPDDLASNRCLGLQTKLDKKSTFRATEITIRLVDCKNQDVFVSSAGRSEDKDFKKAYHESIRAAFEDVKDLNYEYLADGVIATPSNHKDDKLYIQSSSSGIKIVDNKDQVVYSLLKTGVEGVYYVKEGGGIVYKKNGEWYASIYFEGNMTNIKLNIETF